MACACKNRLVRKNQFTIELISCSCLRSNVEADIVLLENALKGTDILFIHSKRWRKFAEQPESYQGVGKIYDILADNKQQLNKIYMYGAEPRKPYLHCFLPFPVFFHEMILTVLLCEENMLRIPFHCWCYIFSFFNYSIFKPAHYDSTKKLYFNLIIMLKNE